MRIFVSDSVRSRFYNSPLAVEFAKVMLTMSPDDNIMDDYNLIHFGLGQMMGPAQPITRQRAQVRAGQFLLENIDVLYKWACNDVGKWHDPRAVGFMKLTELERMLTIYNPSYLLNRFCFEVDEANNFY